MGRKIKKLARSKDRLDSETRLLTAAKAVFSAHGYDGATTRMVAERSGVNLSLITRYFGGKRGLLLAVIQQESDGFWSKPLPYPEQPSFSAECACFVEIRFKLMVEHIDFFRIVFVQVLTDPELKKELISKSFRGTDTLKERLEKTLHREQPAKIEAVDRIIEALERMVIASAIFDFMIEEHSKAKCVQQIKHHATMLCRLILSDAEF